MLENFDSVKGQNIKILIFDYFQFSCIWYESTVDSITLFEEIFQKSHLAFEISQNIEILRFWDFSIIFQWHWVAYGKKTWNRKICANILYIRGGKTGINSQYRFKLLKISLSAYQYNLKFLELSMRVSAVINNREKNWKIPKSHFFKILRFWDISKAKWDFWKISSNNVIESTIFAYQIQLNWK